MSKLEKTIIVLAVLLAAAILCCKFWSQGYRLGQINALTGKVGYELVTQSDSTRVWEEIDGK